MEKILMKKIEYVLLEEIDAGEAYVTSYHYGNSLTNLKNEFLGGTTNVEIIFRDNTRIEVGNISEKFAEAIVKRIKSFPRI